LQDNGAVYGQPDYFLLGGEAVAPELKETLGNAGFEQSEVSKID
jgi:hypothetical protein